MVNDGGTSCNNCPGLYSDWRSNKKACRLLYFSNFAAVRTCAHPRLIPTKRKVLLTDCQEAFLFLFIAARNFFTPYNIVLSSGEFAIRLP